GRVCTPVRHGGSGSAYSFHVESVYGFGPATIAIDTKYRTGSASAQLDLYVDSFDDCYVFPENGGGVTVINDVLVSV
ncbi:MAG: hypothetical protein OEO77_09220, partial [Acidimicrobiia bacterium]|nr:hypothetical protein [Acidimicrobiia bacterium]